MKGFILQFGEKLNAAHKIREMGYVPLVVHYQKIDCEHFLLITKEQAINCECDISLFKGYSAADIKGIVVCSEYYVELAAAVRELYFPHLPGLTSDQASLVRDKYRLKQKLIDIGIPCLKFTLLNKPWEEMRGLLGSEFLVKPRRGALTEGIRKISTQWDWDQWLSENNDLNKFYAEEYICNPREYCCDTIVVEDNIIAQFPGEYTVDCLNFRKDKVGIGVNYPGFVNDEALAQIKEFTRRFVKATGIKNGFFHTEYFYTDDGWKFGEVGCRLPGAYQLPTESHIAGCDLLELYLKCFIVTETCTSEDLSLKDKYYGYYIYPVRKGVIRRIRAKFDYPWIVESEIYITNGDRIVDTSTHFFAGHVVYKASCNTILNEMSDLVPTLLELEYADD
ncbi:MAG: hypothetical protein HQM16_03035 [Deltaproteobacteria bacterium]|nr:hypothetical protein [Deltaproteobacteria bacterium]